MLHLYSDLDTAGLPRDPNGFLFNPRWFGSDGQIPAIERRCRFRVATAHLERRSLVVTNPHCLSVDERQRFVTVNEPPQTLGLGVVCVTGAKTGLVRGHVNWFPVTATGMLRWNSFSKGAGDNDVNTDFLTPIPHALTSGNDRAGDEFLEQQMYHLEFYSHETLERIPGAAPGFWSALKRNLLRDKAESTLVNNRFAIVTGLYGLDGVHGFQAELHPVYSMAVLLQSEVKSDSLIEEWAVMARNLGSEGDCAYGTLPLLTSPNTAEVQDFIVDLGETLGATSPIVSMKDAWSSHALLRPKAEISAPKSGENGHVYLRFTHPRPLPGGPDFIFLGSLTIKWAHIPARYERDTVGSMSQRFAQHFCPDEPQSEIRRLSAWFPNYCHPKPNLSAPPVRLAAAGDLQEDNTEYIGVRSAPDPLQRLPDAVLPLSVVSTHATSPRVYAAYAWPLEDSVGRCCQEGTVSDPLSLSGRRLVLGLGGATWARKSLLAGFYVYPHSGHYSGEEGGADFYNFFTYFGWRADFRKDSFYPITKKDTVTHYGLLRSGYGVRLSPFLSPNTVQLSEHISLMPYTIASLGASVYKEDGLQATWGWGLGMQAQIRSTDAFIDIQNSIRGGGYVNHWIYSTGVLLPLGR